MSQYTTKDDLLVRAREALIDLQDTVVQCHIDMGTSSAHPRCPICKDVVKTIDLLNDLCEELATRSLDCEICDQPLSCSRCS